MKPRGGAGGSSGAARARLPNRRRSRTFDLNLHGLKFTATISRFSDGQLAGIFLLNQQTRQPSQLQRARLRSGCFPGVAIWLSVAGAAASGAVRRTRPTVVAPRRRSRRHRKARAMTTIADFPGELQGVKATADGGWSARCPAHDDQHASLSVRHRDGKWLLCCHSGCTQDQVIAALGVPASALFDEPRKRLNGGNGASAAASPRVVATYIYRQGDGTPYLRVQRTADKAFWQRHWDGNGWAPKKPQGPKIPYRLPDCRRAARRVGLHLRGREGLRQPRQARLRRHLQQRGRGQRQRQQVDDGPQRPLQGSARVHPAGQRHARAQARAARRAQPRRSRRVG